MDITISLPDDWKVTAHGHSLDGVTIGAMPDGAVAYLLANGFTQSLTDAAAFSKADKEGKSEAEVTEMAADARARRFNAILAGEVGARSRGPRAKGLDAVINDVAIERLRRAPAFVSGDRAWPTGKGSAEVIRAMVAKLLADDRYAPAIRAEAERRVAAESELAVDLDV